MASATVFGASFAAVGRRLAPWRPRGRLPVSAAIAAVSFVSYILARIVDGGPSTVLSAAGVGACGWAWLVARALFDPEDRDALWAPLVAVSVAVTGATAVLAPPDSVFQRVAENAYVLTGSAALLLTFIEPWLRWRPDLPAAEKRFRIAFTALYAVLVTVSVLGLLPTGNSPSELFRDDMVKAGSASVSLLAMAFAVGFRARRPLTVASSSRRRTATEEDVALAARLTGLLEREALETLPELRIADIASRLGEPEHRVSRCITALGFTNFNRWINHHRIVRARTMLSDPAEARSILQIAFACGFASLGPFNRAFRDDTGMTPREFRSRPQPPPSATATR